jgi:phosphoadenosine phosphosulfate reductase
MPAPDARSERPVPPSLTGEVDPGGSIWKEGAFRRDPWRASPTGGELASPLLLDKARWAAERGTLLLRPAPIGLALEAGESVDDVADDLTRFALIALNFAKFSDGRGFSTARLLREKFGYGGELRAVGNVLSDQIPFMRRVGFDAFEVHHPPTRRALSEGRIAEVRLYYQPVGPAPGPGTRTWLRGRVG